MNSSMIIKNIYVLMLPILKKLKNTTIFLAPILYLFPGCQVMAETQPNYTIDIYRTKQITVEMIKARFGKDMQSLSEIMISQDSMSSPENMRLVSNIFERTISGLNEMGEFAYINISPTMYPQDKIIHISFDIVDKTDEQRLNVFLKKPSKSFHDPDQLIFKMLEYEKMGHALFYKDKKPPTFKVCPAFHCLFGFDHPALQSYKALFNTKVPKNKSRLIAILREDKDENRRAAAAFLMAHIHDGNELIKILSPSIYDSSNIVRNNVMRVIAETTSKVEIKDFPIDDVIRALDFPAASDRNKALFLIFSVIKQLGYESYVIQHAGKYLIEELKLLQPNAHDFAYSILKEVSGENYDKRDYKAWEKWVTLKGQSLDSRNK